LVCLGTFERSSTAARRMPHLTEGFALRPSTGHQMTSVPVEATMRGERPSTLCTEGENAFSEVKLSGACLV
jgi:hypothetical protein